MPNKFFMMGVCICPRRQNNNSHKNIHSYLISKFALIQSFQYVYCTGTFNLNLRVVNKINLAALSAREGSVRPK